MNKPAPALTAAPAEAAPARPLARVSDRLSDPFLEAPPDARSAARPDLASAALSASVRHDGWTPERIRLFLESLAASGVVEDAARAAGMSKQSAYALRNRANGRAFHLAWNAALHLAHRRLVDELTSRAVHGCVDVIVRDGKVWGERHRFDKRLSFALLTRLDRLVVACDDENRNARYVAEEFDEFVGIVCRGAEGEAADFIESRRDADRGYRPCEEAELLERLDTYLRTGAGLPAEEREEPLDEEEEAADEEEEAADEDEDLAEDEPIASGEEEDEWQPSTSSTSPPPDPARTGEGGAPPASSDAQAGPPDPPEKPHWDTAQDDAAWARALGELPEEPKPQRRRTYHCEAPSSGGWMS